MTKVEDIVQSLDVQELLREFGRRTMEGFVRYTKPDYDFNWHHLVLCEKLDQFIAGKIKKLIVTMPPQHGKSELATRRLPALILGKFPTKRIAIESYSAELAKGFNRDVQRIIDSQEYAELFPDTKLGRSKITTHEDPNAVVRSSSLFEIVGHKGKLETVGIGGSITGKTLDVNILDDPFKDRQEAQSPATQDFIWSQYIDVVRTRFHNDSQELIIMTRWSEDDLVGRLLKKEKDWEVIVYQGIKERDIPGDPRKMGEALWPQRHSLERILAIKANNRITFDSLYQQEPGAPKELLVYPEWSEIAKMPDYLIPVYGIDFGNPFAVIEVAAHNNNIYLNEVLYDTTNPTNAAVKLQLHKMGINLQRRFVCDSAEPRSITDLQTLTKYEKEGLSLAMNCIPAKKGPGSLQSGIKKVKEFKIFVTSHSHNLKTELKKYQFVTFNGLPTDEPIDAFNHLLDALRYIVLTLLGAKITTASAGTYD